MFSKKFTKRLLRSGSMKKEENVKMRFKNEGKGDLRNSWSKIQ